MAPFYVRIKFVLILLCGEDGGCREERKSWTLERPERQAKREKSVRHDQKGWAHLASSSRSPEVILGNNEVLHPFHMALRRLVIAGQE